MYLWKKLIVAALFSSSVMDDKGQSNNLYWNPMKLTSAKEIAQSLQASAPKFKKKSAPD